MLNQTLWGDGCLAYVSNFESGSSGILKLDQVQQRSYFIILNI